MYHKTRPPSNREERWIWALLRVLNHHQGLASCEEQNDVDQLSGAALIARTCTVPDQDLMDPVTATDPGRPPLQDEIQGQVLEKRPR